MLGGWEDPFSLPPKLISSYSLTTQIYLVRAKGDTDAIQKEEWMNDIKWFKFHDALDAIEYEDIGKL